MKKICAKARFLKEILMAGSYKGLKLLGDGGVDWTAIILGTVLSAVTAYLCIHVFLKILER